ncbi:MAG: N-acetylmuramoyl-L-alanine amidase [bacterium]
MAAKPVIEAVRFWSGPEHTRIVLDLSEPCRYRVRRASNPERIVVNIPAGEFAATTPLLIEDELIRQVRRNALASKAQLVIDLEFDANFRHFTLAANEFRPDRIVIDIFRPGRDSERIRPPTPRPRPTLTPPVIASPDPVAREEVTAEADEVAETGTEVTTESGADNPFIVIIDAGHGGHDSGAICQGVEEKDVNLKVSLAIAKVLSGLPGYRPILTRESDVYLTLEERVEVAERAGGDLYLSIHCNSHPRAATKGMEVYCLSLASASRHRARELAHEENAATIVGLHDAETSRATVLEVLVDLQLSRVLHHSSRLADTILAAARRSRVITAHSLKQAGFEVLRSLVMPSALVELAYLTNKQERMLLTSSRGPAQLARIVVTGVLDYREDDTSLALLSRDTDFGQAPQVEVAVGSVQ